MVSKRWFLLLLAVVAVTAATAAGTQAALQPPRNTALPTIAGTAAVGRVLNSTPGSWTGSTPMSYGYQWQRCTRTGSCTAISGATASTYTAQAADAGDTLRVLVTASNKRGKASATSAATGAVPGSGSGSGSGALFTGDFETDDLSQWDNSFQQQPGRFSVVSSDGSVAPRDGHYMGRVEVRAGDDPIGTGGNICQVYRYNNVSGHYDVLGNDRYYAFSLYLPSGFPYVPNQLFNYFFEMHGDVSGQASFKIGLNSIIGPSNPSVGFVAELESGSSPSSPTQTLWRLGDLVTGQWVDFVAHVRWASDQTGIVEVWVNGTKVVSATGIQTWYSTGQTTVKPQLGYYRAAYSQTAVLYLDAMKIGDSYASVTS